MNPLDTRFRPHPEAAARNIAGEAVVVTPADSKVHELDAVGTFIFEACDGTRTGREVAGLVAASFEVSLETAQRDVAAFLSLLAERRVLEAV